MNDKCKNKAIRCSDVDNWIIGRCNNFYMLLLANALTGEWEQQRELARGKDEISYKTGDMARLCGDPHHTRNGINSQGEVGGPI